MDWGRGEKKLGFLLVSCCCPIGQTAGTKEKAGDDWSSMDLKAVPPSKYLFCGLFRRWGGVINQRQQSIRHLSM